MVTDFQFIPADSEEHPHANYFWILEGRASQKEPYIHAVVPNGTCTLLYVYKGSFQTSSPGQGFEAGDLVVCGQTDTPARYVLNKDFGLFAVCLQPYVLPLLTGVAGEKWMNQSFQSSDFPLLSELSAKLRLADSNHERRSVFDESLKSHWQKIERSDDGFLGVVREMRKLFPEDLQFAVSESRLSSRQFQRKFKTLTGFTPVQFLRLVRLQSILDRSNSEKLTEMAHQFGYFDQSHFINDFKKITGGITPGQYFAGVEELKWKTLGESVAYFQS